MSSSAMTFDAAFWAAGALTAEEHDAARRE